MRPMNLSITGVGVSAWIPVDWRQQNFQLEISTVVSGGAVTYNIEHTTTNLYDTSLTPNIRQHPSGSALTAGTEVSYTMPIFAFRINITAGSGTVTVDALQQSGD